MNANYEWLRMPGGWRLKRLDIIAPVRGGFCREAAIEYSPGLQPWVRQTKTGALKVAPDVGAARGIKMLLPEHTARSPLLRQSLDCPLGITPCDAGLEVLSGRFNSLPNPGLKPWAVMCNRFAVARSTDRARTPGIDPARRFTHRVWLVQPLELPNLETFPGAACLTPKAFGGCQNFRPYTRRGK